MPLNYYQLQSQFEQYIRVERNLADRTRAAYLYDLTRFQEFLITLHGRLPALKGIDDRAIREYLNHLQLERGCKSATLARVIASLRHFFQFAVERGELEASPAARIRTPKQPQRLPVYLVPQELTRLLESPSAEKRSAERDTAILTMLAFTGTRLSEIVGVNMKDLDLLNRTVRVLGKGNKERIVPLNDVVVRALNDYIGVRLMTDSNALFLNKSGKRLTGRSVENIVRKYALKSGIFKDGMSPHKLRHTFATLLHAHEVDLIEIKSLMGHANIASTQIYTHTSNSRLRTAVKKLERI